MDGREYNAFLESKDDKHRTWPRRVEESKDKEAKRAYRKKCEDFATHDGLLFKTNRRMKHETGALSSMRAEDQSRYRVIKMYEKMRLLDWIHKDPAGGSLWCS